MTDKLSDDELRGIVVHDAMPWLSAMARELLTLRRREREARELLASNDAIGVGDWYGRRDKWLSEGAEHE